MKGQTPTIEDLSRLNVTYACKNLDVLAEMKGILERHEDSIEGGADIAFDAVDHCRPAPQSGHQSGNRASANRLIGLKALADENLSGKGVNVVDRGLNNNDIESKLKGKFGGGWAIGLERLV